MKIPALPLLIAGCAVVIAVVVILTIGKVGHGYSAHPAKTANHACVEHHGVARVESPDSGFVLIVCRDGVAVQVDY